MKTTKKGSTGSGNTRFVGRRKLIKVLAAGGGVVTGAALIPERWTAPIVEAVSLPAHAQTSGVMLGDRVGQSLAVTSRLLEQLVPSARAVGVPEAGTVQAILGGCIIITIEGDFIQVTLSSEFFNDSGSVSGFNSSVFDVNVGPYVVGINLNNDLTSSSSVVVCTNWTFAYNATTQGADCAAGDPGAYGTPLP